MASWPLTSTPAKTHVKKADDEGLAVGLSKDGGQVGAAVPFLCVWCLSWSRASVPLALPWGDAPLPAVPTLSPTCHVAGTLSPLEPTRLRFRVLGSWVPCQPWVPRGMQTSSAALAALEHGGGRPGPPVFILPWLHYPTVHDLQHRLQDGAICAGSQLQAP